MRAGWNTALAQRVQAIDSTARIMIDGRVTAAADLRQRYDQWLNNPGLDSLPGTAELLPDGGVRLKATATLGPNSTIINAYARDKASLTSPPFIDPLQNDGAVLKTRLAALVQWYGNRSPQQELTQVQVRLHPHFDPTKPKTVAQWRLDLYNVQTIYAQLQAGQLPWKLQPIASKLAPATGDAEGWVAFVFGNAERPRPKSYPSPLVGPSGPTPGQQPWTLAVVTGYDANGSPASNIAWGLDNGHSSTVVSNDVLQGWLLKWLNPATVQNPASGALETVQTAAAAGAIGAVDAAGGGSATVPGIQFSYAQYTTTTVAFTTHPLVLSPTPTTPPELVLRGEVPIGASLTAQVSADNVTFYAFTDGQTVDTVGPGLPTQATYYVKATLTTNTPQDATPILRGIGAQVVTITDLSDVAEVESVQWVLDPVRMKSEVPELTLRAIHDGERDFRDAITTFLSKGPLANLLLRLWVGDAKLGRSQWLHLDDFLIDDVVFNADHARITGIHPLALMKQALPVLTPEVAGIPNADNANPGVWVSSAGSGPLWQQIADGGGAPDDTTYIASPANPVNAAYTAALSGIGTPVIPGGAAQQVGIEVQVRAALAAGVGPLTLSLALLEGATQRALRNFTINSTTLTQPVFRLTSGEIASIGNWSNLLLKLSANGTGTLQVTWARLVQLAMRPPLSYANQAIGVVAQDLLVNQLALDGRYRGPTIVDPSPALTVSKTIQAAGGGSTDLGQAKAELEALAWLMGGAWVPEQGKFRFRAFYDVTPAAGNVVGFVPRADEIKALFPAEEVEPQVITPGYRQRVPVFPARWGFNATDNSWQGEAKGYFGPAFTNFGPATVDADVNLDATVAQWLADAFLAGGVATRHVNSFGMGLLVQRIKGAVRHPELSLGDLVAFETDRFAAYDPVSLRSITGRLWATGFVVGIYDGWGTDLAIWIPSWLNLVPITNQTPAAQPPPTPQATQIVSWDSYWRANHLYVNWQGNATVGSVKLATSNSAYPAAGTGTSTDGQTGTADASTWLYGDTVYVTLTPYSGPGATGLQGTPVQFRVQLMAHPKIFLEASGQLLPGGAAFDSQARGLEGLVSTPELLPNAEFDLWKTTAQPYSWSVDTGDSSVAARDGATVFSGDYAAKFSFGAGGSAATYRGFTTADEIKGAFCMQLRPGLSYRIKVASRVSAIGASESYRLTVTFKAAGGSSASQVFAYAAATTWQVDTWVFTVPTDAEPNSQLAIEFTRGNTVAHDFWVDSVRVAEDVPSTADLVNQLASTGQDFILNGGFEQGLAYWRHISGTAPVADTVAPFTGAKALKSTGASTAGCTMHMCDRQADVVGVDYVNPPGTDRQGNDIYIKVQPGDEIHASAALKTDSATNGLAQVMVDEYDQNKTFIQTTILFNTQQTTYGTFTGGVVVSGTTYYVVPRLFVGATIATASSGWIDELHMWRVTPKARTKVYRSAVKSVNTATTTPMDWDTESYDVGNQHDTVTNNSRITVQDAGYGKVQLVAEIQWAAGTTGYRQVQIRKNGATILAEDSRNGTNTITTTQQCCAEDDKPAKGDYYEVLVTHTQGAALNVNNGVGVSFFTFQHIY